MTPGIAEFTLLENVSDEFVVPLCVVSRKTVLTGGKKKEREIKEIVRIVK